MGRILVIASDFPYPPNHGGRKDVWDKIIAFQKEGHIVDLITTVKELPEEKDLLYVRNFINNVQIIKRKIYLKDVFSIFPLQYESREELKRIEIKGKYDYVIVEGDYVLPIVENPDINGKIIFRMHNNEAKYFKQLMLSERSLVKKLYYFTESLKFKTLYEKVVSKLETIWFISKDELESFKSKNVKFQGLFIPPHVESDFSKPNDKDNKNVLFLGSLFMTNNIEAITWYLKNIHDSLSKEFPDYQLFIAGNTRGGSIQSIINEISKLTFKDNIIIYKSPETLNDIYSNCTVFVNPMQHGAGIKLKTIEAMQKGLAVVSTSVGSEGTGMKDNEHLLISDIPEKFKENVKELLLNKSKREMLINNSHKYLNDEFNLQRKLKTILK